MTAGALLALLLAAATLAFVLAPLFRKDAGAQERRASALSEEEELLSQREMALAALKDLEEDRATGKIGDLDYEDFKSRLTAQALDVLKRLDARREQNAAAERVVPHVLRHPKAR